MVIRPRSDLPLSDLTVVALEQAVTGPFCSRQLADLGARVIKVERPDGGDFARGYDGAYIALARRLGCAREERLECGMVTIATAKHQPRDSAGVPNVVERVSVEQQQIGHVALDNRA